MNDTRKFQFYSIDDRLVLRWKGPGSLVEHYTREGWVLWPNPKRFSTEAEAISEEEAKELIKARERRFAQLKAETEAA